MGKTIMPKISQSNHSPSASDKSTTCKGGSVNDAATRSGVGKSHSLGPRTA